MERILSRESEIQERSIGFEKINIGITGVSKGVGVSFLTACLARYLANTKVNKPAVVEFGNGTLFDSIGADKRFAGRNYFRFFEELHNERSIRGMENMDEGINWILTSPAEHRIELSLEKKLRIINHAKGNIVLCDLSGQEKDDLTLLNYMDKIIVVIDPLPSKMLSGYEKICKLKNLENQGPEIIYVINKLNKGVNRRQMGDFLKLKKPVIIPMIEAESIYAAEYNCKIPYSLSDVKKIMKEPLEELTFWINSL